MPASINGTTLEISGQGNTLESVYTDINDITIVSKSGTDYYVDGTKANKIEVLSGGELTIGNPNDFSYQERLLHEWNGVNGQNRFFTYEGSHLKIYGSSSLIANYGCTSTDYPNYTYIYGNLLMSGSEEYKPRLSGGSRTIVYMNSTNVNYVLESYLILNKCKIGDAYSDNFIIDSITSYHHTMLINDITMISPTYNDKVYFTKKNNIGQFGYNKSPITGYHKYEDGAIGNYTFYGQNGRYYLKDWTLDMGGTNTYPMQLEQLSQVASYENPDLELKIDKQMKKSGQRIDHIFENFSIINSPSAYLMILPRSILFKDCSNPDNKRILNGYYNSNSCVMCWNSPDFLFINYSRPTVIKDVKALTLTVIDKNGNPIEDAAIQIKQSSGLEEFNLLTNENGKLIVDWNLELVLLTYRQAITTRVTSEDQLDIWSSSSNGTYHEVKILKDGYLSIIKQYEMDQNIEDTIILKKIYKNENSNIKINTTNQCNIILNNKNNSNIYINSNNTNKISLIHKEI